MRLILTLILALPLFAQLDIPLMSKRPGLSRSALAAGVQAGSANLMLHSADFTNAAWTKTNVTHDAGIILETETTGYHSVQQTATVATEGIAYTGAFEAKANGRDWVAVRFTSGTGFASSGTYVNLSTCTLGAVFQSSGTGVSGRSATAVDNGYCRVTFSKVALATVADAGVYIATASGDNKGANGESMAGDVTKGILLRAAQYGKGSTALPYVPTTDLQSIASLPPGTATLVRGATTAASTDDPTVSLAGWNFDAGDRAVLPAKGANWTTTNCSGVECYTVTSAGTEYVNGVARRNLLRWSEDFSQTAWTKSRVTESAGTLTNTTDTGQHGITRTEMTLAATSYVSMFEVKAGTLSRVGLQTFDGTTERVSLFNLSDGSIVSANAGHAASISAVDSGYYKIQVIWTGAVTAAGQTGLRLVKDDNTITWAGSTSETLLVRRAQLERFAVFTAYQKTTDSREWLLETPGNYVGLLTGWYRWDRVLNPGEVLNNYRTYQRPRLNAVGNTLP